jgi:hypothetical protein
LVNIGGIQKDTHVHLACGRYFITNYGEKGSGG